MHTYSPITADQYAKLLDALHGSPLVSKLTTGGDTGSCTVEGEVDLTWLYQPTTISVDVTIVTKHGAAHFVSDASIYSQIEQKFIVPARA